MIKTTVTIDSMVCGMCEAHINDAVRAALPVKKVSSSCARGEAVILSDTSLDAAKLRAAVSATGYTVLSLREETIEKRSLFSFLHP